MKKILLFCLFIITLSACATPEAPGVFGKVEKNGQPVSNEEVVLVMTVNGSDSGSQKMKTDATGFYAFDKVTPGTYYLLISVASDGTTGCSTSSPGFSILNLSATNDTGATIIISMATSSGDPFEIEAGDRLIKDILFSCN